MKKKLLKSHINCKSIPSKMQVNLQMIRIKALQPQSILGAIKLAAIRPNLRPT